MLTATGVSLSPRNPTDYVGAIRVGTGYITVIQGGGDDYRDRHPGPNDLLWLVQISRSTFGVWGTLKLEDEHFTLAQHYNFEEKIIFLWINAATSFLELAAKYLSHA